MEINNEYGEPIFELQQLCSSLISEPQNDVLQKLKKIRRILDVLPKRIVQKESKHLMGAFFFYLRPSEAFQTKLDVKEKLVLCLTSIFDKSTTENVYVYKNVNGYLLHEIYDPAKDSKVKDHCEEYKLIIINCIKSLHNSISYDVVKLAYNKEFIIILSSLVYVCLGLAQQEALRSLRISSIECIMSIAKVNNGSDTSNMDISCITADLFMHFFPGICRVLTNIILEDQKTGHKVLCVSIKCFGKITWLLMQDYHNKNKGKKIKVSDFNKTSENVSSPNMVIENKWRNSDEIKNYLENVNRNIDWFVKTDSHLLDVFEKLLKLCYHTQEKVRLEFALICEEIIRNCHYAIPKTSTKIFEALITLSEDSDENVSKISQNALNYLQILKSDDPEFCMKLFDDFEINFFDTMNNVPSIFHSIDDNKKLSQINLLCGYLKLFKEYKISTLLYNTANLRHFILSLLTICTIDKLNLRFFDVYAIQDFDLKDLPTKTPWRVYKYHTDVDIFNKLQKLFVWLAEREIIENIFYYLMDIFEKEQDYKKEATLLLNAIVSECTDENIKNEISKSLILTYLDEQNLNMPISATNLITLNDTHENVIQICLQLEGVGKLALNIGEYCNKLLLKMMYPIIEKAGSLNSLIRLAGLKCLSDVSKACGFTSVTELINQNSDYFSYHVTRKLKHYKNNKSVLDVYGVIMKHCSVNILDSVADILENAFQQSSATLNTEDQIPFLRIYDIFLKCLIRWFDIKILLSPVKSKQQKLNELYKEKEDLFETNQDFSNEVTKKSVEELWKEDYENDQGKTEEIDNHKVKAEKVNLPIQIKLTILILKTSLNYLSCPKDDIKILVLEILKNGVEIIRNYDDELLPIVHKIWTPLQYRFKYSTKPLIFKLSYELLVTLARVSKDFIRRRTSDKALPFILKELSELSKNSYLKDRGSEYRNTQAYKLQTVLLENLGRLIIDIEITSEDTRNVFKTAELYLSDKQPLPLQTLCVDFYKTMLFYDPDITMKYLNALNREEYKKNIETICSNQI